MGERWIKECAEHLEQISKALSVENSDRLDLVKSMHITLLALNHSVWGWLQYVNNPDIMGKFKRDELNEISDYLNKFAQDFIKYDIKVTKLGMKKGMDEIRQNQQNQQNKQSFYV